MNRFLTLSMIIFVGFAGLAASPESYAASNSLTGTALVQDDATLKVRGKTVRLFGIYIPPSGRTCRSNLRPVKCAPRAALALKFKIRGFVHCLPRVRYQDRSVGATCHVGKTFSKPGTDLAAYLLEQGWAVARPEAPFEYHVLSNIARQRHLGVWGLHADVITGS